MKTVKFYVKKHCFQSENYDFYRCLLFPKPIGLNVKIVHFREEWVARQNLKKKFKCFFVFIEQWLLSYHIHAIFSKLDT